MGNNLNKFTFMRERLVIYQTLTRGEQPDEGVEVDEKNDQIAHRRMRSRMGNPKESWANNSPETPRFWSRLKFWRNTALNSFLRLDSRR